MATSSPNLHKLLNEIAQKRGFLQHNQKGAVMFKCELKLDPDELLKDIEIYNPKNPKHFWMGVSCRDPHITVHHGFELEKYEEMAKEDGDGEKMFREDVETILKALEDDDRLKNHGEQEKSFTDRMKAEMHGHADFFPANPTTMAAGEDNYYTVVFKADPPKELRDFRDALLKVLPHTQSFPTWSTHLSIATVPDEKNRDKLIKKLNNLTFKATELKIGYNIKK